MDHSQHAGLPAGAASDQSLYHLEASWQNQQAQTVSLAAAQGKVQLVATVYASCENACPRIIADMKAIEDKLAASSGAQLQLTLVSIDPEVDTPARLQALADKIQLSPRWQLLTGDPDDVLTLAALLGVQYKKISETDYAHSNIISVLNPAGEIVHQQQGLGVDPAQTVAAVQAALSAS
ncbi:MAG: SCO family protein [Candidatus Sericytochromatia bacterium]|nr:SCO family protein [Candidatus Sericytochromatia bacterium]